jgi:hypothetical protein
MELIKAWKKLLEESTYPPEEPFNTEWVSLGKGFNRKALGNWDTPLISHEITFLNLEMAKSLMEVYLFSSFKQDDGMMAYRVIAESDVYSKPEEKGPSFICSHPPVWMFTVKKILDKQWDERFAKLCFEIGEKNLLWWENNRMDRYNLFWYMDSFPDAKIPESGYENSPRWDFTDIGPFPCVDLNCQILLHLRTLKFIGEKIGVKKQQIGLLNKKINSLQIILERYLWDEKEEFYCDYELTGRNTKKTISSYWALICEITPGEDIERFIKPLESKNNFIGNCGLTSVSLSEPCFSLDFWRGPMWLSQVFWICVGLQKYGFTDMAKKIAGVSLDNINKVYKETGKLWEFYNPIDGDISKLKRNGNKTGPFPDYLGHNPIISLEKIREGEII